MTSTHPLSSGTVGRYHRIYSLSLLNAPVYPNDSLSFTCLIFTKIRDKTELSKRTLLYMFAI